MAGKKENFHPVSIPNSSRPTDLVWSERSLSLPALLKETSLPAIVKMNAEDKSKTRKDASSLLQQPLLLYKEQKGYKVVAKNISSLVTMKKGKDAVDYKEGGAVIVLPVDYQGWFRMLEDDTIPLLNVAALARVMPTSFLSARKVTGFTLIDPLNKKDIMYEKLEFPAGIFHIHSLYEDYVRYITEKNTTKRKLLRCLVCITAEGLDLLLPLDEAGEFYIVQRKKSESKNAKSDKNSCAYTLKQLVAMGMFKKPVVLKLLLGEHPNKPCGFTGVIKVVDIVKDWTLIAETLDGKRKLLELPVLPFPEFTQATNGKELLQTGSLRSEVMFMSGGAADHYSKEIKVKTSFHLEGGGQKPDGPQLPPVSGKPDIPPLILKGVTKKRVSKTS